MSKKYTFLFVVSFVLLVLGFKAVVAADKTGPLTANKVATGSLVEDVVFTEDTIFAMPADIILDSDNNCHIFGFVILGEVNDATREGVGIVKRLVCQNTKSEKGFDIWNVHGDFVPTTAQGDSAVTIPVEVSEVEGKTHYTVKADTKVTVTPTKIGTKREGRHIYLFANNLTPKPFKIHLAQLPSFGGEKLETIEDIQLEQ